MNKLKQEFILEKDNLEKAKAKVETILYSTKADLCKAKYISKKKHVLTTEQRAQLDSFAQEHKLSLSFI